jgi:hypothetical protein
MKKQAGHFIAACSLPAVPPTFLPHLSSKISSWQGVGYPLGALLTADTSMLRSCLCGKATSDLGGKTPQRPLSDVVPHRASWQVVSVDNWYPLPRLIAQLAGTITINISMRRYLSTTLQRGCLSFTKGATAAETVEAKRGF